MQLYAKTGRTLHALAKPFLGFFMKPTSVRVRVLVINDQNECLLVRGWISNQSWDVPGGGIGWGEASKAAAVREVKEETGVTIAISELKELGIFSLPEQDVPCLLQGYQTHANGKTKRLGWLHRIEIMQAAWFPLSKLPKDRYKTVDELIGRAGLA